MAITPAALTVNGATTSNPYTSNSQTNVLAASTGLLGSDTVTGVTGLATRTNVGTTNDLLSAATGTGLSNYNITYAPGSLAITPAAANNNPITPFIPRVETPTVSLIAKSAISNLIVAEAATSNPLVMPVIQSIQVSEVISQPQAMNITKDPFVIEAMNNLIETSKSVRKVFYDTAQLDGNSYDKYDGVNTASDFAPSSLVEVRYPTISTLSAHANPATQKMIQETFYSSAGHMTRVADLSLTIAKNLNLPSSVIDEIFIAGKLHDIGLPNALSNLSSSDFAYQVINESQLGYQKLKEANFSDSIAQMVQQHHERIDGSGFMKLSGNGIGLGGRILAVADTLESLSGHGNHLEALEPINMNRALQEIHNGSGRQFDPKIVQSCMNVFSKGYLFPTALQAASWQIHIA